MQNLDHAFFLILNFDGGPLVDRLMFALSSVGVWLPLYGMIGWLVWRQYGWRNTLIFIALIAIAIGVSDMIAGIFKHNGLLGNLLSDFTPRLRPMFTPSLEGLDITADSLAALRRTGTPGEWAVHVPVEAVSGRYGTVSAHAATIVALAVFSASVIRQRWFTWIATLSALLICYSRIYLAKHFPMDLVWGTLVGIALGYAALRVFRLATRPKSR